MRYYKVTGHTPMEYLKSVNCNIIKYKWDYQNNCFQWIIFQSGSFVFDRAELWKHRVMVKRLTDSEVEDHICDSESKGDIFKPDEAEEIEEVRFNDIEGPKIIRMTTGFKFDKNNPWSDDNY